MNALGKLRYGVNYMYTNHLLVTNIVSYGGLLAMGDFVVQHISFVKNKEGKYDYYRTGRMIAIGCILGPFNHYWYSFLDKAVKGHGMKVVGKKILCDQFVAGPFFCSSFLFGTTLLEGQGVNAAVDELKSKFLPVYLVDWAFWPAAQFINFRFLSTRYRVLYVGFCTLLWNSFLSFVKHLNLENKQETVKEAKTEGVQAT